MPPLPESRFPSDNLPSSVDAFELMQMTLFDLPEIKRRRWRSARNAANKRNGRLLLAGGIILDQRDRILLIHRATPSLQQWETPGGKVNPGESPEEAAVREIREELGVVARVTGDLGAHDIDTTHFSFRYALFEMKVTQGTPTVIETETFDEIRFFAGHELIQFIPKLSPNAANYLRLQIRGRVRKVPLNNSNE